MKDLHDKSLGLSAGMPHTHDANAPGCSACDQHIWSYTGETGPDHWGQLCAPVCSNGKRQSPIAILDPVYKSLPTITYHRLSPTPSLILKNYGFTPKTRYASDPESTYIQFSGSSVKYQFGEFHFHMPGEHTLHNRYYEMEMHLVHTDTSDPNNNVAIAVLISEGLHNPKFDAIFGNLPGGDRCQETKIPYQNIYDLLPTDRRYYTYPGSLTTPDCSETVTFVILNGEIQLSYDQIATFHSYLAKQGYDKTNRPLQPVGDRAVETNVPQ